MVVVLFDLCWRPGAVHSDLQECQPDSRTVGSRHRRQKKAVPGGSFPVAFFGFRKDSVAHTPVGLFILSGSDLCIAVASECLGVSHGTSLL